MDDTGMSDLQFKASLKQPVGRLKDANKQPSEELTREKLEGIIDDLKGDIER